MKASSRNTLVLAIAAAAVVVVRTGLPALLIWLVNAAARKIPGIRGKVRRMQINFLAPGVTLSGVSVATLYTPGHRIEVGVIALNSQWKDLLRGALVASLRVRAPRLLINAAGMRGSYAGDGKKQKTSSDKAGTPWQEKITQLPRFKIASVLLTDGAISVAQGSPLAKIPTFNADLSSSGIVRGVLGAAFVDQGLRGRLIIVNLALCAGGPIR